jgi:PAS domain S-box-containing protein
VYTVWEVRPTDDLKRGTTAVRSTKSRTGRYGITAAYHFRWLAWAAPVAFVLAAAGVYALAPSGSAESALVLATGNTLFISATSFTVTLLAARTFAVTGEKAALAMGCGTLVLAIVLLLAGPFVSFDVNLGVTVHNAGVMLAGAGFLVSALLAFRGVSALSPASRAWPNIAAAYAGVAAVTAVLVWAAWTGLTPAFIVPQTGVTTVREVVLGAAVVEFLGAAAVLAALYRRTGSPFTRWYAPGLAMIGVGLATVWLGVPGSTITWVGRVGQWMGGVYLLIAILASVEQSGVWAVPLREALRASERRFRELVESLPELVWTCDASGAAAYLSPQWLAFTGAAEADQLGGGWLQRVHPDDRGPRDRAWGEAVAGAGAFDMELRLRRHDGVYHWFRSRAVPMRDDNGAVFQWLGADTDVDDQRRTEEALRDSEAHFRAFFEEASVGMATSDPAKGWLEANDALCAMLGYSREELRHVTWADLTHPDDLEADTAQFERVLGGEIDGYALDKRFTHKGGSLVYVHLVVHVVRDEAGRPLYFAAVMEDISERKRAEDQLTRLNQELEDRVSERTAQLLAANQEAEAFAYSVSHDLRAPLRAIDGFSEILEEDYRDALDDAGRDNLDRVRAAAQRMARIIEDLLSLSRLSRHEIDLADVDLSRLAGKVVDDLRQGEPQRHVVVALPQSCVVRTDAGLAEVLLANLLGNAWKFTSRQDHAHIELSETTRDGERVFFVRDDGAGFDPHCADRLFRPLERLHDAADYPGNGIGLATVRRIASRLGGRCWAEGAEGKGATFYFTLGAPTG